MMKWYEKYLSIVPDVSQVVFINVTRVSWALSFLLSLFSLAILQWPQDTAMGSQERKLDRLYLEPLGSFIQPHLLLRSELSGPVWPGNTLPLFGQYCCLWHSGIFAVYQMALALFCSDISHWVALYNTERLSLCLDESMFSSNSVNISLHLCFCLDSLDLVVLICVIGLAFWTLRKNTEVKYSRECWQHF